jgi:hypothetical protein
MGRIVLPIGIFWQGADRWLTLWQSLIRHREPVYWDALEALMVPIPAVKSEAMNNSMAFQGERTVADDCCTRINRVKFSDRG